MKRKPGDGNRTNVTVVQHRLESAMKLVAAEQDVEITAVVGRQNRVGLSRDAGVQVRQEVAVIHAAQIEARTDRVLALEEISAKEIEHALPAGSVVVVSEEQTRCARLGLRGWRMRQSQRIDGFKVLSLRAVVRPAFIIDQ